MAPVIRLGGEVPPADDHASPPDRERIRTSRVALGGIETRAIAAGGRGAPALLLHGWLDNAETWLGVLNRLAAEHRPAVAYDLPGFGTAPPLDGGSVLDQLVDFCEVAVSELADSSGREVVVAGNSLGGWAALRLAERSDLPIAGVVPIGPAGIHMAPAFFTVDRVPAVSRIIGMPAPVPPALVRSVAAQLYRALAFADPAAVEQAVVDRFTRFNVDRRVIAARLDYAKRLRAELDHPFDPAAIAAPVIALWGDRDRLCMPAGAERLRELLPAADVRMLAGVGHTPQIEAPEAVLEAIGELAATARKLR